MTRLLPDIPIHDFSRDDARSIPFRLLPMEEKDDHDVSIPHRHNYYEIFLFKRGGGTHIIDLNNHAIEDNSVHFVSPGQVHRVQRNKGSHGQVIFFSRDFLLARYSDKHFLFDLPFLNGNSPHPLIKPDKKEAAALWQLFDMMKQEVAESNPNDEIIGSFLKVFLLRCQRVYNRQRPAEAELVTDVLLKGFRVALEQHFRTYHQVQDYAGLLTTSSKNLNEHCKKATGKTAGQYIADRLVLEARRLLLHSDLSVKEIAYFLGFQDPAHFTNFLKTQTGQSPTAIRQQVV